MLSRMRVPVVVMTTAAVLHLAGCSFVFVDPPHGDSFRKTGECTSDVAAPTIDTILAGTNLGVPLYLAAQSDTKNKGALLAAGIGSAALWLASAFYGFGNVTACSNLETREVRAPEVQPQWTPRPTSSSTSRAPSTSAPVPPQPRRVRQQQDDDDPHARRPPPPAVWPMGVDPATGN